MIGNVKPSTVKAWLMRAWKLDREIDQMLEERKAIFERITSITAQLTGDTVSSTKDPHKFEQYALYEAEIDSKVDKLCAVKIEITQAIDQLEDTRQRQVLYNRFIRFMTLEQTAVNMGYSYPQVCRIQGDAFNSIKPIVLEKMR